MQQVPFKNTNHLHHKLQPLFALNNVSFRYETKGKMVLKDIALSIDPGEVLFITGRSGAGKSTLLNIIAGILSPSAGNFSAQDTDSSFIANVFQDLKLFEQRKVDENLWYAFDRKVYKN
jgi:ABC-type bacteriocin/lantibiotic exporter with double-glycine peptidase domain